MCNSHRQRGQDSKGLGVNERRNHLHLGPTLVRTREQLISLEYGICTPSRQHRGYSEDLETQRAKDPSSPSLRSTVAEEQQVTAEWVTVKGTEEITGALQRNESKTRLVYGIACTRVGPYLVCPACMLVALHTVHRTYLLPHLGHFQSLRISEPFLPLSLLAVHASLSLT